MTLKEAVDAGAKLSKSMNVTTEEREALKVLVRLAEGRLYGHDSSDSA